MKALGIVLFAIGAAVAYGILHDQVTARVCVEYFTIGHPRLIDSESPTVLGLFWGVIATWWVGAGLGIPLALASRLGRSPKLGWKDLRLPMAWLLGAMAILASLAGLVTAHLLTDSSPDLLGFYTGSDVPPEARRLFLADGAAHLMSYAVGCLGGVALILQTVWRRRRLAKEQSIAAAKAASRKM